MWHDEPEPTFDIIALAASAGGVLATREILSKLSADFPLPILVAQHRAIRTELAEVLDWSTKLNVQDARHGDLPMPGNVYLAPAGCHISLAADRSLIVDNAPRINFVRPSANVLFASMARHVGPRSIAVVLTGTGNDGTAGAREIRKRGGTVIVQDRQSSRHFEMPCSVIEELVADMVLPLEHIAFALTSLAMGSKFVA